MIDNGESPLSTGQEEQACLFGGHVHGDRPARHPRVGQSEAGAVQVRGQVGSDEGADETSGLREQEHVDVVVGEAGPGLIDGNVHW
nr:hypothetical protein [Amycolatopsis sp. CB00013]